MRAPMPSSGAQIETATVEPRGDASRGRMRHQPVDERQPR